MHRSTTLLLLVAATSRTYAQTLYDAISKVSELSNFTSLYTSRSDFSALFTNTSLYPITFLVPNNDAFTNYQASTGQSLTNLTSEELLPLVQYHTLVSSLNKENFTGDQDDDNGGGNGITIPTTLTGEEYNNRSVGIALAGRFGGPQRSAGQVVFIRPADSGSSSKFILSRQDSGPSNSISIRSGLSSNVNLTALDDTQGTWEGGRFHIIDGLLTPPAPCSNTVRTAGLGALDNALNRSGLWNALDHSQNVTCLGPSDEAFKQSGNLDQSLTQEELVKALHFHTLPEVAYSDYLEDGMEFTSLQNMTVRVKVEGSGQGRTIWFNNARVINANVLACNGLMHVLDAIMKPLEELNGTATGTPTASATASATGAASTGAVTTVKVDSWGWWIVGLLGMVSLFQTGSGTWLLFAC